MEFENTSDNILKQYEIVQLEGNLLTNNKEKINSRFHKMLASKKT